MIAHHTHHLVVKQEVVDRKSKIFDGKPDAFIRGKTPILTDTKECEGMGNLHISLLQ
jgi:hypothetical protein